MSTDGVHRLWRDLCQGYQHESPLCHTWMRNRQVILCHAEIIKKNDVYVNWSWAITERWLPSVGAFNCFCIFQKLWRRKCSLAGTNNIVESWLVEIPDWLCLIYRRDSIDLYYVAQTL